MRNVLHLVIHKTRDILYASDGPLTYSARAELAVVRDKPLRQLRLDKGIITFEDEVVNIDPSGNTNSETALRFMLEVIPTAEPEGVVRCGLPRKQSRDHE